MGCPLRSIPSFEISVSHKCRNLLHRQIGKISLFICVFKDYDTANVEIQQNEVTQLDWDEIKFFLDARFITAPEAAFRIFEFPMHGISHTIVTLAVHLHEEQPVYFEPGNELRALLNQS